MSKRKNWSAAKAAPVPTPSDSDAVALMRTFESLKSKLQQNEHNTDSCRDTIQEVTTEARLQIDKNEAMMAALHRERRELEVKLTNVQELLKQQIYVGGSIERAAMDQCARGI